MIWPWQKGSADIASCKEVMRSLQSYLDGEIRDEVTARRIAAHLEICKRCGLEASTLAELKRSLRELDPGIDAGTLNRLESFARTLEDDSNDPFKEGTQD